MNLDQDFVMDIDRMAVKIEGPYMGNCGEVDPCFGFGLVGFFVCLRPSH